MSLWDSIKSGATNALSSAYNSVESTTSGFIDSAKQGFSAVGDGLANLAEKGIIATTMDNKPSPGPVDAPAKKSGSAVLIVAAVGAIVGVYFLTRKKG